MKKRFSLLFILLVLLHSIVLPASASEEAADEYDTGITFEQLERTPDKYINEKVKFSGTVLQVLEGEDENQGRLMLDGTSGDVLYFGYDPSLLDIRLLEDDEITISGVSYGLYTYESILGKKITLPAVWVDKIEFSGQGAIDGNSAGSFNEDEVISQLDVKHLHYKDYFNYDFLVIQNNSEYDLTISADVRYYDESGSLIGIDSREENAVEAGYPTVLWFMPDEDYAKMEYTLSVEKETWYEPVLSDLSYEENIVNNKVLLSVTNNGTEAAEFVEGIVLFYSNGELVNFGSSYFTDDDFEIKPGDTIIEEIYSFESFDSYEVYFTGRR